VRSTNRSASAGSDASCIGHALRLVEDDTAELWLTSDLCV